MTRWCPVCESPGRPVAGRTRPVENREKMMKVSPDLPGIEPSHHCTNCPTFFCGKDRFYLTARHGNGVHGIAVWPHRERHLSIEIGEEGLIVTFNDGTSVLIPPDDTSYLATNFFQRFSENDITAWAGRRGFRLRIVPGQGTTADLKVEPPGPHFILLVTKSWFQSKEIRCPEDGIYYLEMAGAKPVVFPARAVHA